MTAESGIPQTAIFLINLDTSPDRLVKARAQLDAADLTFTRISAFDGRGKDLSTFAEYDREATLSWFGRDLMGGEIGCYISHLRAIDAFLASDADYALVLEDDLQLKPGGIAVIKTLVETATTNAINFSLCNLAFPAIMARQKIKTINAEGHLFPMYRAYYPPITTIALLWTRAGAAAFRNTHSRISAPIDDWIRHVESGTGNVLAFDPSPITTSQRNSDIGANELDLRFSWSKTDPQSHRRYQRRTFRNKLRAYTRLMVAKLTGR